MINTAREEGVLNPSERSFLCPNFFATPYFYYLPKAHKDLLRPPGRPIIAAIDGLTSNLSDYVDSFLQPIVQQLLAYIQDSSHLLDTLNHYIWDTDYHWVSLDVISLYTPIPHDVVIEAAHYFLCKEETLNPTQVKFMLQAIKLILHHNYFEFEQEYYLQTRSTAMGASFAPSYANLFMAYWEDLNIWTENLFARHLVYVRYIDKVIVIWHGDTNLSQKFPQYCNNNTFGIHFKSVTDPNELIFLNLELYHDQDFKLCSLTHFKPTAGNSYLHRKSVNCLHKKWISNIPYSQFCLLERNCISIKDYKAQSQVLGKNFWRKAIMKKILTLPFENTLKNTDWPTTAVGGSLV